MDLISFLISADRPKVMTIKIIAAAFLKWFKIFVFINWHAYLFLFQKTAIVILKSPALLNTNSYSLTLFE